jgi:Leucine-rich repeat (LRR) protein
METKAEQKADFFPNKIASSILKLLPKTNETNTSHSVTTVNSNSNNTTTTTTTSNGGPTNAEILQRFLPKMPRMYSTFHGFTLKKKRFLAKKVAATTLIRSNSLKNGRANASIKIISSADAATVAAASSKRNKKNLAQKTKNMKFDVAWDILTRNVVSSICIKYRELTSDKLHESFKSSEKLKKIEISNCELVDETLPDALFKNCKELRLLIIRKNNLKSLDRNVFQQMKYLDSLNLSTNQMKSLDDALLHNCVSLSHLDLSNNFLEDLSENVFSSCENLQMLNLANNQIESLRENVFRELKRLKYVNLANNKIASLKANIFQECSDLRKIDLNGNLMDKLNESFIAELVNFFNFTKKSYKISYNLRKISRE